MTDDNARFRDFDAAIAEKGAEPIVFRLGGREWTVVNTSSPLLLRLAREMGTGNTVLGYEATLRGMVGEGAWDDLSAVLEERNVSIRELMDIVNWVVASASGVPFDEQSPSPAPPSETGTDSRVVSLSGGSRSSTSHSAAG